MWGTTEHREHTKQTTWFWFKAPVVWRGGRIIRFPVTERVMWKFKISKKQCERKDRWRLSRQMSVKSIKKKTGVYIYPVSQLQSYILKAAGVADKRSASGRGLGALQQTCVISSSLLEALYSSKCFIYLNLGVFATLKHKTWARNLLLWSPSCCRPVCRPLTVIYAHLFASFF